MDYDTLHKSGASTAAARRLLSLERCRALAGRVIEMWKHEGVPVDARAALRENSALADHKSVVLDLAYEEYCLRIERGESISVGEFCGKFPGCEHSIRAQIEIHNVVRHRRELLPIFQSVPKSGQPPPVGETYPGSAAGRTFGSGPDAARPEPGTSIQQPEPRWPAAGDRLVGYTIVEEIGRGGFARVYLAREGALGDRDVVIKVSRACGADEANTLGKLDHENIVPVHSVRFDEKRGFSLICMPHLGRCTLGDVLAYLRLPDEGNRHASPASARSRQGFHAQTRQRPRRASVFLLAARRRESVPNGSRAGRGGSAAEVGERPGSQPHRLLSHGCYVDGVLHLMAQLAEAMAAAHAQGVLHLDIKPSNVLLTAKGVPKLLDFNLASEAANQIVRPGGTPPFMSPEQLEVFNDPAAAGRIDGRCDVFSLGLMMYQLLCGRLPHGELPNLDKPCEAAPKLREMLRRGHRSVRSHNPDVDPGVERIVDRCLAFEPQQRFATPGELARALRDQLRPGRRLARWVVGRPYLSRTIALASTALLVAAAMYVAMRGPSHLRNLAYGESAFQQGNYPAAVRYFERALKANPDCVDAVLFRARAQLADGQFEHACGGLRQFLEQANDPRAWAMLGYCSTKIATHRNAIHAYENAIAAGIKSAEVFNNLGYSSLKLNRPGQAIPYLTTALRLDGRLVAARHNRALSHLKIAERQDRFPEAAIEDIEYAIALDATIGELHRDAARIYALASRFDSRFEALCVGSLTTAFSLGISRDFFAGNIVVGPFLDQTTPRPNDARHPAANHTRFVEPAVLRHRAAVR